MFVYKITNKINGKIYIGRCSSSLKRRLTKHFSCAKLDIKTRIGSAIRKYGRDNFNIECIEEVADKKTAIERETFYIRILDATNGHIGYNIIDNGHCGGSEYVSEESKLKISLKNKGKKHTLEAKKKISEASKIMHTPEFDKRISIMMSGTNNPFYGKEHTEETKVKMRKSKNTGASNPASKLNYPIVCKIRSLFEKGSSVNSLSDKFNISKTQTRRIINGESWVKNV